MMEDPRYSKIGKVYNGFGTFQLKSVLIKNDAGDWGTEPNENAVGIIRSTNFNNNGKLDLSDIAYRTLSPQKFEDKKLSSSDILIERSGGSDTQPVGRIGYITDDMTDKKLSFANFIQRISLDETVDAKFVYYCLQQMYEMGITASMQFQTTGIRNLDWKFYLKTYLPKPTKEEQTAIANILSMVDEAIASVLNSIAAAERLKKSLMQNLLTGKMKPDGTFRTPEEFYIDENFGKVPVGWEVKRGTEITTKITKGQSPKWQGFDYQQEGILFVTSENIQNGYIDISKPKYLPLEFNNKIRNSQLEKGDILINIVGASIGRCAIFNIDIECANINQAVCVFRPDAENDSMFLSLYLQSETTQNRLFRTQVETARANLSLGDFRKFKFVIPQKEEQIKIANRINLFDIEREKLIERILVLERLKKSLMQNLLTGKVTIIR